MTEKDEAQIEREKTALAAMKNARTVMQSVLDRENTLSTGLMSLIRDIECRLQHVPALPDPYNGDGNRARTMRQALEQAISKAKGIL